MGADEGDERSLDRLIADLGRHGTDRELAGGEVLCRQGEDSTGAFVVRSGRLDAEVEVGGVAMVMARHGPGSLVGEVTTVVGGPRTATLTAGGPTVVSVIAKGALSAWLDSHPEAARTVLDLARERTDRNRAASTLAEHLGIEDRDLVVAMAQRLVIEAQPAGSVLVTAGAAPPAAGLILSGRVATVSEDGTEIEHARGRVIGLEGLFGDPSPVEVRTTRDSTIGWLHRTEFAALVTTHPLPGVRLVRRLSTPSAPAVRTGRTVAVLTADPDGPELLATMAAGVEPYASVLVLDRSTVDSLLGTPGVAQRSRHEPGDRRIEELLHQVEVDHEVVLLHVVPGDGGWLERVVRHADHVVVWGDGTPRSGGPALVAEARRTAAPPVWLAVRHPPDVRLPAGTAELRDRLRVDEIHHVRPGRVDDVERVGRLAAGRGHGLVLSGGGGRGFAHLGAIASLRQQGVPIDRVAGASMGAVVAGTVALGYEGEELLALVERQFRGLLDYTVPLVSVLKGERIAAAIVESFEGRDIEDLWIPFSCVTTNLTRNRIEHHRTGSLELAVRGSVAIPGILPPVPFGDDLLVDGGVLDNLPLDLATDDASIGTVVAVDVSPTHGPAAETDFGLSVSGWSALRDRLPGAKHRLPTLASVLMRSMTVGSARQRDERLARGVADLYLHLDLDGVGLLDFEHVRRVAARGKAAADPEIAAWLSGAEAVSGA